MLSKRLFIVTSLSCGQCEECVAVGLTPDNDEIQQDIVIEIMQDDARKFHVNQAVELHLTETKFTDDP